MKLPSKLSELHVIHVNIYDRHVNKVELKQTLNEKCEKIKNK